MDMQYDAFISYRHHPLDSAIAAEIQRRLEHFRVPRAIRMQTGKARINRIFRDKAELAITSDINDDILQALEHASFLIVICSTHTAESLWVQREIEIFLRTHSRHQVLTVLADGEPQNVIPELLRWQTQSVQDADGSTQEVRVPVEPLSCDYRGNRRTAHREELPRLAAALLGCPYDALRQRQRQHQMRRLAVSFSAALLLMGALAGYFLWSSLRIRENYQAALRSQSRYLAEESLNLTESGDRIAAAQLALAALPSDTQDRPLVAEAEYALGMALGAYTAPGSSSIASVCSFPLSATVRKFFLNEDSSRLFTLDLSNTVSIWDTGTYVCLFTRTFSDSISELLLADGGQSLLVTSSGQIAAYNCETGALRWQYAAAQGEWLNTEALVLTPDGDTVCLQCSSTGDDFQTVCSLLPLDIRTGEPGTPLVLPAEADGINVLLPCISPDGRYLAFSCFSTAEDGETQYRVLRCDLESGALLEAPQTFVSIKNLCFTDAGNLAVLAASQTGGSGDFYGLTTIVPCDTLLFSFDPADFSEQFSASFSVAQVSYSSVLQSIVFPEESGEETQALCCADANRCLVYRESDGALLQSWEFPDAIIAMETRENGVRFVLHDGQWAYAPFDRPEVSSARYFPDDLVGAAIGDCIVTQTRSSAELLLYRRNVSDESWIPAAENGTIASPSSGIPAGNALLIPDADGNLHLLDPEAEALRWSIEADASRPLGLSTDGNTYYFTDSTQQAVQRIALQDGSSATRSLAIPEDLRANRLAYANGRFLCWASDLDSSALCLFTEEGKLERSIPLSSGQFSIPAALLPAPDGAHVLLTDNNGTAVLVDLETGALTSLADISNGANTLAAWSPDGKLFAYTQANGIVLCGIDGACRAVISCGALTPAALYITEDGETLLAACSDQTLYRYTMDGALCGKTTLASLRTTGTAHWTETGDGHLVLQNGTIANVLDEESWSLSAYVPCCLGYTADRFTAFSQSADGYGLGFFPRYTAQALIDKANAALGGAALSEERKLEYGLE